MKTESYVQIVLVRVLSLMLVALNTPTANCLICCRLLLLHLPQSGYIGCKCKLPFIHEIAAVIAFFDVLLTVHLSIILAINRLNKQNLYYTPLHVLSTMCSSSGGQNCIIQSLVSSHIYVAVPCTPVETENL